MNDLTFLPAVQMAEQIRHRKISPVELVEAHLRKIKKLNPVLNAFVQVDAEGAFRQAREAEVAVRRGAKLGAHEAELSPILKEFSSWVEAEPSHTGESLLDAWIQRDAIRMQ